MEHYWQLKVGDHVRVTDAHSDEHDAVVMPVLSTWRDRSGSHAVTTRGDFPKAWVRLDGRREPVPWPVADIEWPNG